jgi:hypothetical protein
VAATVSFTKSWTLCPIDRGGAFDGRIVHAVPAAGRQTPTRNIRVAESGVVTRC